MFIIEIRKMKKIWLWILWCIILIGLLVLLYIKQTTVDTRTKGCLPNNMENKTDDLQGVKSICEDNWWIIQPYDDEWGNFSLCLFDDWSFCESWELYRWECGKWDKQFEDFLEAMSGSEGITAGEEQNESFYDWMRIKCIESWYNWVQWDCMSWENIIEIIDSDPYVDDYFDWFTWTILNWTEIKLFDITWDNTLYYNNKFWFAVNLWEQWKWWKIELKTHNEQFWENAIWRSIHFYKEWFDYDVYSLSIDKIEKYDSMKKQDVFWTEDEFEKWIKWKNNKYFFVGYASDQLAPYIDITDEYQQLFLVWFVFYDIEEPVSEESEIWRNSINLWEELLWNEEGVIFEPKKWKWQMPCIWWCDNWKDTEYVEWWYYEYTNPSLWVKITTPDWENGNWNTIFLEKRETPLFLLSWNSIYSLEYVRDNEDLKHAEYIKWYKKDSLMSLEELLDKTYSSSWCNLRKYDINQSLGTHFKWAWEYYYEFVSNDGNVYNDCAWEDWENWGWPIIFIESKDWEKFYKVSIWDWCAPGPCSIFWKIEVL